MRGKEPARLWVGIASLVLGAMFLVPMGVGSAESPVISDASQGYGEVLLVTGDTNYRIYPIKDSSSGKTTVDCSASRDGGATWTTPAHISAAMRGVMKIAAAVYGSDVCVAWEDATSRAFTTFCAMSADSGKSWSRQLEIGGSRPSVAVNSDGIFISTVNENGNVKITVSQHGQATQVSETNFGLYCTEAALSFDASGNRMLALYGGTAQENGGAPNDWGIYQTIDNDGDWQEPECLFKLTGSNRDLFIENGKLAWRQTTAKRMSNLRTELPKYGSPANTVTIASSSLTETSVDSQTAIPTRLPPKKWTFVVYGDGDNNLAKYMAENVDQMELVGSNADLNIIVLADYLNYGTFTETQTRCYYVTYDTQMGPTGLYTSTSTIHSTIIPLNSINASWGTELDMSNPQTAIDFMNFVYDTYPAQKYAWTFWNHGGSWNGPGGMQCWDDTTGGSDALTALETRNMYEQCRAHNNRRYLFDVLSFDECVVADMEALYDAKQYSNYTTFSEDSIGAMGYPYDDNLGHLAGNTNMGGEEFGYWLCHEYFDHYPPGDDYTTLSEINNTAFDYDLMEAIENFGQKMRHKASTCNAAIKTAASNAMDWQGVTFQPDLRHFAQLITTGISNATDAQINAAAWRVVQLMAANAATDTYGSGSWQHNRPILVHDANTNANGLTIYANEAYDTTYNTLALSTYSNWGKFVQNVWGTPSNVNNVEPTVAITTPSEGAYVVYNTVATITGTSADSDGTVQRVEVKIDREAWQTATGTTSWTYNWNLAGWAPGPHRIQARSYDGTDYSMVWMDRNVTEIVDPNLADLTLWSNQITFSNPTPSEGDTVTIGATIHNVGTVNDAANVQVGFYVGDPAAGGSLIGTYVTTTPSTIVHNNNTGTASVMWNTAGWAGSRQIYVMADPGYTINELTDANNTKSKAISVSGYAVDLTCAANTSTVQAGASHTYPITVKNLGTMTDTIQLTIDNPTTWGANFNDNPQGKSVADSAIERLVDGYHTYAEVQAELAAIEAAHPTIAKRYKLATTAEGRNVTVLKISDNVATNETEPGALIIGNHHAREWMTVEISLYFANYLVDNYGADPQATWLVDNREIYILPNLNPDGLQYSQFTDNMWRKNRRNNGDGTYGVDLNRNYNGSQDGNPTGAWGATGTSHVTSDDTYCGPAPFSEPETRAVMELMLARTNLALSISYHSYAEEIYWPWGYSTGVQTPDDAFQEIIANDFAAINGYAPMQSAVPYATSGDTDDWAYGYFHYNTARTFFPFTIETNSDFQPAASEIIPTCQLNLGVCLEGAKRAGDLLKTAPTITHTPLPNTINTATPYNVVASFSSSAGVDASSLQMFWKTTGSYTPVAMTPTGTPGEYEASIPAQPDGTWVSYYVRGASAPGTVSTSPDYAPNARNSFFVGNDVVVYNVTLAPGASRIVNLTVTAPPGALPNEQAKIDAIGTSVSNPMKSDSVETVTTVSPSILLVNDGNAAIAQYQTALTNGGYRYDNGTPSSDLFKYRIVIWATDGSSTLAPAEKSALMDFMDDGGSVYINGEDIGYDIATDDDTAVGLGATAATNFYGARLHATYVADDSNGLTAKGDAGDAITDGMTGYTVTGSFPESITARDLYGDSIFTYDAGTVVGAIKVDTGVYKLVYIGFEYFEGTDTQAHKNLLMQRILEWLNPDNAPIVTVTAPTAANTIASGSYTIHWTATDDNPFPATPTKIEYSADGGTAWNTIVTNTANTGSYVWNTVPRTDGVNYLVRVTATDSIGQATSDVSDNQFSIDNTANDQWHLQVQTSVAGFKDLDMKPVELADNTYYSEITAPGQFLLGDQRFLSGAMAATVNVQGTWTFGVWGRVTAGAANGRLYAKAYSYNGVSTSLLFQTGNDDETVGSYTVFHEFSWTYSAPSATVPAGQKVCVEIWLDATAGSGSSNVQNLANADIPVSGTVTGTNALTQAQDDNPQTVREVAGWTPASVMTQNFDNGGAMPAGWTLTTTGRAWEMTNDNARYGAIVGAPTTDYGAVCDSDLAGSGVTVNSWIKSPVFDCTGYTVVTLKFTHNYNWYGEVSPEGIYVYVANDGAVTQADTQVYFSTGADIALSTLSINITSVAGNSNNIQIGWNYRANYDYWWVIDDVEVTGNRSTSSMEHKWTASVPAGKSPYTFRIDSHHTANAEGDDFVFAYSTDDVAYTNMVTVTATADSDTYQTYALPTTLSGTVYIRVRDADRTAGRTILDIIRIDHMYIESVEGPPQMIIGYDWGAHQSFVRPALSTSSAYFRVPVVTGWNFISMPIVPASTSMPAALTDGDGDTTWTRAMWFNPNTPADPWKQYNSAWPGFMNDLSSVNVQMGVWVYVTVVGDGFINITGSAPGTQGILLKAGWNLVGYPASNDATYNVGNLKTDTGATIVEGFSAPATYKTAVLLNAYVLKKGEAYWICVPADTTWTVSW
ncbi:MAG: M14 family zinc carboxypeptidase [Methanobacteriota archaeon]